MPIPPPTADDVQRLADDLGLGVSPEDVRTMVAWLQPMLEVLGAATPGAAPAAPPADREVLGPPAEGEDPFNAIRVRCRVPGSGRGRLAGWRIGVKDTISVAGVPLGCGSRLLEGFVPDRDATVVSRMLGDGAEIVAVLNMDDLAVSPSGETSAYGPVLNPHDPDRLAGGSSGGSAAALFYDDFDATLGGDQGGSIRIPSSWCGTVGLKPTFGLVPYTGVVGADATLDHVGPMARSVERVARVLDVIAGPDPEDPRQRAVPPIDALSALEAGAVGLRVGVLKEGFTHPAVDPGVAERVRRALDGLARAGASLVEISVPAHAQGGRLLAPILCEGFAALLENGGVMPHLGGRHDPRLAAAIREAWPARARELSPMAKMLLLWGRILRQQGHGSAYAAAQNARPALRAAYDRVLREVDVLVMPTTPTPAARWRPDLDPIARIAASMAITANTAVFDLTGHPSLSVPCGELDGLPVGLMCTGRHFEDGLVLRAGRAVEVALA